MFCLTFLFIKKLNKKLKKLLSLINFVEVLKTLIPMCSAGANVRDICKFGDEQITKEAERVFKREKEMLKGD